MQQVFAKFVVSLQISFDISHSGNGHDIIIIDASLGSDLDGDGLSDNFEQCFDGNCIVYNLFDPVANSTGTDLDFNNRDTDQDGYSDRSEISTASNPIDSSSVPTTTPDGDLNFDALVNAADVLLAQRYILGKVILSAEQIAHGDLYPASGDGQLGLSDLLLITKTSLQ